MEDTNRSHPVAEEIDRYRREMLALYRQQAITAQTAPTPSPPAQAAPTAPPEPTQPPVQRPQPQPQPDIPSFPYEDGDLNGEPPFPVEPPAPQPPIEESPFVGYLRVFVFTGNGAEPLQGARVAVTRREGDSEILYANTETNRDGFTPVIPLPSVNPALTLQPDIPQPFVPYDIRVTAEGFRPALHQNVPVYGNNYVTQPVSLVPLLPGEDPGDNQIFQSGGPADL